MFALSELGHSPPQLVERQKLFLIVTGIAAPLMPWIDAATWQSVKIRSWDAPVAF